LWKLLILRGLDKGSQFHWPKPKKKSRAVKPAAPFEKLRAGNRLDQRAARVITRVIAIGYGDLAHGFRSGQGFRSLVSY
jgi:hypothetical protein